MTDRLIVNREIIAVHREKDGKDVTTCEQSAEFQGFEVGGTDGAGTPSVPTEVGEISFAALYQKLSLAFIQLCPSNPGPPAVSVFPATQCYVAR